MSIFNNRIGIDLGTNETVIYLSKKGIVLREPTIIAVDKTTNKVLAIGHDAKVMIGKNPSEIYLESPIKSGVVTDYKLAVNLISYFINKAVGKYNFFKPEVMINIASSISGTERRAVMEAVLEAGAKEVFVVKEPILAAVGSGVAIAEANGRMVINIGAGTTDVAIISLGGVVFSKSIRIGGNKMDEEIIKMVSEKHNVAIGARTAEIIKNSIGSAVEVKEDKAVKVKGRDLTSGLPKEITVSSNEVAECLHGVLVEILKVSREVFANTPPELSSDIIDNGILLTGGTSQLQNLDILLERELKVKTEIVDDPKLSVAYGMGSILGHVDAYKRAVVSKKAE